jgi:hypothetical protein
MDRKLISSLLGISEKSFYRWKESRAIFKLLEKYFTDEDIEEFFRTGKIKRFEEFEDLKTLYTIAIKEYFCFSEKRKPKTRNYV